ncbi:MAG: hypothetical protein ACPG5W_02275 [Flavobacteriales bacterium]
MSKPETAERHQNNLADLLNDMDSTSLIYLRGILIKLILLAPPERLDAEERNALAELLTSLNWID